MSQLETDPHADQEVLGSNFILKGVFAKIKIEQRLNNLNWIPSLQIFRLSDMFNKRSILEFIFIKPKPTSF